MGKYGQAAIRATSFIKQRAATAPEDAWSRAVAETFPNSISSQQKGCPRGAYLGLCEEGLVSGVPAGRYTRSQDNKRYAIQAVRLLWREPALAQDRKMLWRRIMNGVTKRANSQMDIVVALWEKGLIERP